MARHENLSSLFTDVANAMRDKFGLTGQLKADDFDTTIASIPVKAAAIITPGISDQTIAASQYLSGDQTIKGDANLVASNIAKGVSIFGISGTHEAFEPIGTLEITTNGIYNVYDYSLASVSIAGGDNTLIPWLESYNKDVFE